MENTNIFIGGLPADIDDAKLRSVFASYGTITWSRVMMSGGKPTAAAIIEFADVAEARWCVENLDGNIPEGLTDPINVNFKRDNRDKGKGKGWYGKGWSSYGKDGSGKGKDGNGKDGDGKDSGGKGWWSSKGGKGYSPYEGGKSQKWQEWE
eukprot:CAMPEP_0179041406 /NCGR_PEP_ID=MMETSP0796-20121207/16140_1 /TAXON_ID=73915 /ORGANISM="Pyrodinium bahamense, Strain pbaha01" /LENGTH=150 /DNA_ID=CAMNT_0020737769 /DNA_START=106 /DNA_END=558 /DNA_ORIENTATION=+